MIFANDKQGFILDVEVNNESFLSRVTALFSLLEITNLHKIRGTYARGNLAITGYLKTHNKFSLNYFGTNRYNKKCILCIFEVYQ